jgi:predicted enzyme related to lactoylglutathione lyase
MLKGLRTIIYPVTDLAQAKEFYSALTGTIPYFDQPFYVGYDVGGYELGLDPNQTPATSTNGPCTYWGVDIIESALHSVLAIGAKPHTPITDVGDSIKVATVLDPFGNVVGLIENPHFKIIV